MALQILIKSARNQKQAGIFVAFEENANRIKLNAASFGWDIQSLQEDNLFFSMRSRTVTLTSQKPLI